METMLRIQKLCLFGAFSLISCSSLQPHLRPIEPIAEIGKPPHGMRWATASEKAAVVDLIAAALRERSEREVPIPLSVCIGHLDLPQNWSWATGPNAPLHGGNEWSEAYDSSADNARIVVSGTMSGGSFCGIRVLVIPWESRVRPNNSFKPTPLRGAA